MNTEFDKQLQKDILEAARKAGTIGQFGDYVEFKHEPSEKEKNETCEKLKADVRRGAKDSGYRVVGEGEFVFKAFNARSMTSDPATNDTWTIGYKVYGVKGR